MLPTLLSSRKKTSLHPMTAQPIRLYQPTQWEASIFWTPRFLQLTLWLLEPLQTTPLFPIKASSSELPMVHHSSHILNSKSSTYSQIKSLLLASESLSHVWLFVTQWTMQSMEFSRPVGSLSLLQGIFPTQGSKLTEYLAQGIPWWFRWLRLHALIVIGISSIPGI